MSIYYKYIVTKDTYMSLENWINNKLSNPTQLTEISEIKLKSILDSITDSNVSFDHTFCNVGHNYLGAALRKQGYNCEDLEDLDSHSKTYDYIIAADEWLTIADNEDHQQQKIEDICNASRIGFVTTFKDYKNMNFNQRSFYDPFQIKTDDGNIVLIKYRDWSMLDRQKWTETHYALKDQEVLYSNTINKRTMYFKQLAKFASDAGSKNFQVNKKLMYKSLFSKNQDYIIYISF